jgi:lysophospholipase L1-like esterase
VSRILVLAGVLLSAGGLPGCGGGAKGVDSESAGSAAGDPSGEGSHGDDGTGDGSEGTGDETGGGTGDETGGGEAGDDGETTEHCTEVDAFVPVFGAVTDTWAAQDAAAPWPSGGLVVVGSSSIRRWEDLARSHSAHEVIQRGFGGAQLGEVALLADSLISVHEPAGVVVFAGTNDVAFGVEPAVVGERLRCLRQRLRASLGETLPIVFIGITPTPARWSLHAENTAVNAVAEAIAEDDPAFFYADVPAAFLATGEPPDAGFFVGDGLHLSESGYALWDGVITPVIADAMDPTALPGTAPLAPGERVLVDLGASDTTNGEPSASPDHLGQHWNNWHALPGGAQVYPGERLAGLVTTEGTATELELVVTGGFFNNGREHGGLLWPDGELLGDLAVGTATQDFFYSVAEDQTGGLALRGLDPGERYTLRLFASRATSERRTTRTTLHGAETAVALLQTSGPGSGVDDGNDHAVVVFENVQPDAHGRLHLDLAPEEGPYAYLSLLELSAATPAPEGP